MLAALPLLAGCGGEAGSAHTTSLHGTVTRGPISPTCVRGQSCTKPAPGVKLGFSKGGAVVARATTSADGSYHVGLVGGRYEVVGPPGLKPTRVSVPDSGSSRLDFSIDTRIR